MTKTDLKDYDVPPEIRDYIKKTDIEITEYIERGYNGEVYFGRRLKMNDEVVLKFYCSTCKFDSSEEAVVLKNLNHENILKVWDLKFVHPSYAVFISPKIQGGDLQSIIEDQRLSTKDALSIIEKILLGLNELHSKHNLVHRDLKPGNILYDKKNKQPIIADLGAVKKMTEANNYVTTSKATILYLPPESIIDKKYYYKSDIYQVGIIMFQLLGGYFPIDSPRKFFTNKENKKLDKLPKNEFGTEFDRLINSKICSGKIFDYNSLPQYLDPKFKTVLKKALHRDHKNRYSKVSFFLQEVNKLFNKYPNYIQEQDYLIIEHSDKSFRLSLNNEHTILEKKTNTKWRKDNRHDGTFESALNIARKN